MKIFQVVVLLSLSCFLLPISGGAQDKPIFLQKTKFIQFNNFTEFLHLGVGGTFFGEYWRTDAKGFTEVTIDNYSYKRPNYLHYSSYLKASMDIRVNLIEYFDILSLSMCAPIGLGVTRWNKYSGEEFHGSGGGLTLHTPLFLQLNGFYGSSKEKIDKAGFYLGGGYVFTRHLLNDDFTGRPYKDEKTKAIPAFRFGVNGYISGFEKSWAIDFTYGINPQQYKYTNSYGASYKHRLNTYYAVHVYYLFM